MLDEYLKREDVLNFICEVKTNKCYYTKNNSFVSYTFPVFSELALYIFYDALLKFKIIIDDVDLLSEYLYQLHKLYRKVDSFDELRFTIHKLIARMVSIRYEIINWKEDDREELISIIYDKYVENGYLFHGIHSYYKDSIEKNGFVPELYENYYDRFRNVNDIFHKYTSVSPISKDFSIQKVYFCDDALLGCYYSMYSPFFFFSFLTNRNILGKKIRYDDYLRDSYYYFNSSLKRFMDNNLFRDDDKKYILDLVTDECNLLRKKDKEICLLCVPRKKIIEKEVPLERYLSLDCDIFEVIDRLLSSKYNSVCVEQIFSNHSLEIVSFAPYYERKKEDSKPNKKIFDNNTLLNKYGYVSFLLVLGSLLLSLGIIITIIKMLGG